MPRAKPVMTFTSSWLKFTLKGSILFTTISGHTPTVDIIYKKVSLYTKMNLQ